MSEAQIEQSGDSRIMETLAGLMAAASIFLSLMGLAFRPMRMTVFAALLALVAAAIGGRHKRLAAFALGTAGVCWILGLTIAIVTGHPLY
jgi:hypothetical protein